MDDINLIKLEKNFISLLKSVTNVMPFYIKKIHFWNRDPKSKCHKNGFKRKCLSSRQLTIKTRDWYRTVKQNLDKKSYFERQKEN